MRTINSRTVATSTLALAIALGTMAAPQAAFAADDANEAVEATEITVTARKREESLLSTPIAITALSSADIAKKGIVSLNDLIDATPGINSTSTNSGRNDRSFQQISLRGFTPSTTTSTLTASFIDGVPVASSTALNAISDPARVEVLKGPQNTYFGRNAFAGAINVVNKLPGSTFGGSFSASAYSRSGYDVQGSLEGPLAGDVLGFRLTGRSFQKGGSYVNAFNPSERLGDQRTTNGSLLLVLKPSSQLTVKAFGLYSKDKDGPSAQGIISAYEIRANAGANNVPFATGSNAGTIILPSQSNCNLNGYVSGIKANEARQVKPFICGAVPGLIPGFSPGQNTYVSPAVTAALANGASRFINPADGVQGYGLKRRYYHIHLAADWELGDTGLTLSSLTGWNDEQYSEMADLDNYNGSTVTNPDATAANGRLPFYTFPFLVERINRDFSQELRLSYDKGGALKALIGASYLNTKSVNDLVSIFAETYRGLTRSVNSLSPPQQARTYGLFGSLSYDITSQLSISAEGRWQRDKVYAYAGPVGLVLGQVASTQYGIPAGTYAPLSNFFNKNYDNFMPRVIVNYKITPDIMAYASWSKAANVSIGSFNTNFLGIPAAIPKAQEIGLPVVTRPEKLTNFEIGLKGKALNGKVRFTLAAFAAEWKDQYNNRQTFYLDSNNISQPVNGVANSGRSLLKGLEADVWAEFLPGFTITAAGSYNDTNIRSFVDPSISKLTGVIDGGFVGKSLPLTSKYSFSVSPQVSGDVPGRSDATWFIRSDVNYKSKQYVDAANLTWIKGRTVVNGRIGVNLDKVSIEVFANNLFNNKNYISIANGNLLTQNNELSGPVYNLNTPFAYLNVALPELRTVGVKGSVKF